MCGPVSPWRVLNPVSSSPSPDSRVPPPESPEFGGTRFPARKPPGIPGVREWTVSALLFLLTFLSTTFAGLLYAGADANIIGLSLFALRHPSVLLHGLSFSFTFLTILLAHEFGHFFACKHYGIRCTPPYFIPLPFTLAGTLGAFIRIRSPFNHKRALFDVGIAGPLAGFAFVLPALFIGIANSQLIPRGNIHGAYNFGEPLIFRWIGKMMLGYRPELQDMIAHPIAMGAWFGLLATCLNLFPIWQLDGGHIAYAIFGRNRQKSVSIAGTILLIAISFVGWPFPSYLVFGILLLGLGVRYRFYHPPTLFDEQDVGTARYCLGALALLILVISFTPVPISVS